MEAIWEVISKIGKLVWILLKSGWFVILGAVTFAKNLWAGIVAVYETVVTQANALWAVLTDANEGINSALAAGWPSGMAEGLGLVNTFIPVTESAVYLSILISAFMVCTLIRMVKSCIPAVAS